LTEQVRRKPYSVVLLDEVEKAHPDVFNVLLQVLDDGRLTDNKGRTVNFKNAIIIMTSNLAAAYIREQAEKVDDNNLDEIYSNIKTNVLQILKQHLRPEFINRVDDIIVFHPLDKKAIREIVKMQFVGIQKMLSENGILVHLEDSAIDYLAEQGYDPEWLLPGKLPFGARPIKRLMQKEIVNKMAKEFIAGSVENSVELHISYEQDSLTFSNKRLE